MRYLGAVVILVCVGIAAVVLTIKFNHTQSIENKIDALKVSLQENTPLRQYNDKLAKNICQPKQRDEYDLLFNAVFDQQPIEIDNERFILLHQICSPISYRNFVFEAVLQHERIEYVLSLYTLYGDLLFSNKDRVSNDTKALFEIQKLNEKLLILFEERNKLHDVVLIILKDGMSESEIVQTVEEIFLVEQEIQESLRKKNDLYGILNI